MKIINHWPTLDELSLLETIATEVLTLLVEPFKSEDEAKAFWQECHSTIIILNENTVLAELDNQLHQQISFCINNREFEETLPNGYRLLLAIINDDGAGCYLVLPSSLDISEVIDG